jgi:hypothetical protein
VNDKGVKILNSGELKRNWKNQYHPVSTYDMKPPKTYDVKKAKTNQSWMN